MKCHSVRKRLSLYAGGELGRRKVRALEAHLETCSGCAAELETFRAALARAKSWAATGEAAPLDWTEAEWRRMMAAIVTTPLGKELRQRPLLRPALAAAATFLLVAWGTQSAIRHMLRTSEISPAAASPFVKATEVKPGRAGAGFDRASLAAIAEYAGLRDPKFPVLGSAKQDIPALTMIAPETGLKIVWFINENFNMED